jgi:hypothetical protein
MSMLIFWVVTPCGFIGRYRRFGEDDWIWSVCLFETVVSTCESTRRNNPEQQNPRKQTKVQLYVICKSVFLDFVYRLYFNKSPRFGRWIFLRLQVKRKDRNPSCWAPVWASLSPGVRLAQPGGPTARVSVLPSFLPEDGGRSSFRNVMIY